MYGEQVEAGADTFLLAASETGAGTGSGASLNTSFGALSFESGGDIDTSSGSHWERHSSLVNVAPAASWDSTGKENMWESRVHRESIGNFEYGTDYSGINSLQSVKSDQSSGEGLLDGDEKQAGLFPAQSQLLREQIIVLSRELIQVRNETHSIYISASDLRRCLETETTHRQELAARYEASVKAVATEADAAYRGLQAEIADRIAAQERSLRDISASEDRQAKNILDVRHQCEGIIYQVDARRAELEWECDRLRSQVMDLTDVIDSERRLHAVVDDGLRQELTELRGLLEAEVKNRSAVDVEVDKALKVLTHDYVNRYSSMKQAQQDFDDKLEQETQARITGDSRNENTLEVAMDLLKQELMEESFRHKNAVQCLTENFHRVSTDSESAAAVQFKQEGPKMKHVGESKVIIEEMHQDFQASLEQEAQERLLVHNTPHKILGQEEQHRSAVVIEVQSSFDSLRERLEEDTRTLRQALSDMKCLLDSETQDREGAINKLGADLRSASKMLTKETGERDNECSMLKQFMQNLEAQVSAHVEELRNNHEVEVNKRNAAHEKLEETHRELKGYLDTHGANHQHDPCRATTCGSLLFFLRRFRRRPMIDHPHG